jgi:hypothetical protein
MGNIAHETESMDVGTVLYSNAKLYRKSHNERWAGALLQFDCIGSCQAQYDLSSVLY